MNEDKEMNFKEEINNKLDYMSEAIYIIYKKVDRIEQLNEMLVRIMTEERDVSSDNDEENEDYNDDESEDKDSAVKEKGITNNL